MVNTPLVAFTGLASGTSIIVVDYQYAKSWGCYLFCAFIAITVAALLVGIYYMGRSLIVESYQKLPNLKALKEHSDRLREYWSKQNLPDDEASKKASVDFQEYMNDQFATAASWNSRINVGRGARLHRALISAAIAAAALVPSAGLYVYNKASATDKAYNVKVLDGQPTNSIQIFAEPNMSQKSSGQNGPTQNSSPNQPSPQPSAPIAKPVGPANEFFKSTTIPDRLVKKDK